MRHEGGQGHVQVSGEILFSISLNETEQVTWGSRPRAALAPAFSFFLQVNVLESLHVRNRPGIKFYLYSQFGNLTASFLLVMNPEFGFNALPNELLLLIGDEICEDTHSEVSCSNSKRCHDFFSSFLYRHVSDGAISTLSLSEKSRLELIQLLMSTSFRYRHLVTSQSLFRSRWLLPSTNGAIQSLAFRPTSISLPDAFGNTIPPALKQTEELFLQCSFPVKILRLSLSLAVRSSLCLFNIADCTFWSVVRFIWGFVNCIRNGFQLGELSA